MHDAVVVGGGAGGILALKRLRDAGLDPILFESGDVLGGIWAADSKKMYSSLHANTPRSWMHFADLDFPPGDDAYPHHTGMHIHRHRCPHHSHWRMHYHITVIFTLYSSNRAAARVC